MTGGGALAHVDEVSVGGAEEVVVAVAVSVPLTTLPELLVPPPRGGVRLRRRNRDDQRQRHGPTRQSPPLREGKVEWCYERPFPPNFIKAISRRVVNSS